MAETHARCEIRDNEEIARLISNAIEAGMKNPLFAGAVIGTSTKNVLEAIRPYLCQQAPVSLVKFAISLCVWSNGVKSTRPPMVIWGSLGQTMRHAYIDQAKEALDAQGVPYVD
jgi:hypothetical protein